MGVRGYAALLGARQVRMLVGATLVNGLSMGVPLAIVLAVADAHGYAAAGGVLFANTACIALSSPVRGRLVDRYGQPAVLLGFGALHATALWLLAALAASGASLRALTAVAVLAGTPAPLLASLRPLWGGLVASREELETAYAFQSVLNEVLYVFGPLAAGALAAAASPETALVVLAVAHLAGVSIFVATPASRRWRNEGGERPGWRGALATAGMRTVVVLNVPMGVAYGVLEVAVPAFTAAHGSESAAGIALAALAAGSVVGGLVYGARRWRATPRRRLVLLLAAQAATLAPLALAPSIAALSLMLLVAGLAGAPLVALFFSVMDDVAPPGTATEATAWIVTAFALGAALGSGVAGVAVERAGVDAALSASFVAAAVALAAAAARLPTLGTDVVAPVARAGHGAR